jgi:hypothetical protein
MQAIGTLPRPVHLGNSTPPTGIEARTQRAAALGLSFSEQVTRLPKNGRDVAKRLRRMKRVVKGGADRIGAAYQAERRRFRAAMLTLTYRPGVEWSPRHITELVKRVREYLRRIRAPLRACWVLELQKRGAPHYHLLVWLPRGVTLPKPDKRGWWAHGSTRIEWARSAVGYLVKYASKGDEHAERLPKGARLFAVLGCPTNLSWWRAASWLRAIAEPGQCIRYRRGGWWAVSELAHAWRSPWRIVALHPDSIEITWAGWSAQDVLAIWELDQWQTTTTPPPRPTSTRPLMIPTACPMLSTGAA